MPSRSITTTPTKLYARTEGYTVDFLVQNDPELVTGTPAYFLEDVTQAVSDGIKIVAQDYIAADDWEGDVCLVSSGTSDVRYIIQIKKKAAP